MLDHPSRQNPTRKVQQSSTLIDSESDDNTGMDVDSPVAGTSRGGRGRRQAAAPAATRARGGRRFRARGSTLSRGKVSEHINMIVGTWQLYNSYSSRKGVMP
jgi:hypothetical protein